MWKQLTNTKNNDDSATLTYITITMQRLNDFPLVKSLFQAVRCEYLVDNLIPETTNMDMYGTRLVVDRKWFGNGRRWCSKYPTSILHNDETKQLFISRLDERSLTAKVDIFLNFSDCQHAAVIFSEILSDVIKSLFRKTRCKQNRPPKSPDSNLFNSQI